MISVDLDPKQPGRVLIGGAPEGQDARVLAEICRRAGAATLVHVAIDDARAARLQQALAFFAPGTEVVQFPAWDCLPYDRVSPNPEVVGRRIDTLTRLAGSGRSAQRRIVITTVNALLQRVPPRAAFADATFTARPGDRIDVDQLQQFLSRNGYTRAQTVREPGEFAIRGGIIDLFPPGSGDDEAVRLDLFGDELEQVRSFDPISQRTTGKRDRVELRPMSEAFLDRDSIARFRSGYRELFGAVTDEDPLYEAVSAGRKQAGMEHWLPLFHPEMETLLDYLPDAPVTLDHQAEEAREARLAQIADFYEARRTMQDVEQIGRAHV